MKRLFFMLSLLLSLTACNDSGNKKENDQNSPVSSERKEREEENNTSNRIIDTAETSDKKIYISESEENKSVAGTISGKYIKKDHSEDSDCSCYCVNIDFSGSSELCLADNELYIKAHFNKNGNKIDVYYDGKASKTNNTEIPWEKFDQSVRIAEIMPAENGGVELDWKGFTIDGEIAIDYALYGKKTLEGTYKKL